MRSYLGLIHKDLGSDYGVSFPDFPGCISVGRDLPELMEMGCEALRLHIEEMEADGVEIPTPSPFILFKGKPCDGVALFTV